MAPPRRPTPLWLAARRRATPRPRGRQTRQTVVPLAGAPAPPGQVGARGFMHYGNKALPSPFAAKGPVPCRTALMTSPPRAPCPPRPRPRSAAQPGRTQRARLAFEKDANNFVSKLLRMLVAPREVARTRAAKPSTFPAPLTDPEFPVVESNPPPPPTPLSSADGSVVKSHGAPCRAGTPRARVRARSEAAYLPG